MSPLIFALNSFAFLCGKSLQDNLALTIGFSLLSGELLGASVHRKRFFSPFFSVVKEGDIFRGLLKRAGLCRSIPGHSPSTGCCVWKRTRELPGALANLLVTSRESEFVACLWRGCRHRQDGFALSIMHHFPRELASGSPCF